MRKYKEVKVSELFAIRRGKGLPKQKRVNGNIPLITASKYKNGVVDYIDAELCDMPVFKGGIITINVYGNTFFHDYDCCASDDVCVLINEIMSDEVKLYIAGVIDKMARNEYEFFNKFRIRDGEKLVVKLPVDDYGSLDFVYMEEYIRALQKEVVCAAA